MRVALGSVIDGSVETEGRSFDIGPGIVGSIGVARQWSRAPWFVAGTLGIGVSRVTTREMVAGAARESLIAGDARVGVTAGRTFGPISPYVLARAFGGPVLWTYDGDDTSGSDTHHFQLGAGVSASFASRFTMLVDVAALGERSASLGLAVDL